MATDQVEQSGAVTPNHGVIWTTDGVIQDGGLPTNGNASGYGVTLISGSGAGYGLNDAPVTGPYHQMLLGVGTNGHGFLSWQNFSSATATPFDFIINGTTISIGGSNWLSAIIDQQLGSTQGDLLYRSASVWTVLAPGNIGQVLGTGGAGGNPSWVNGSGTGTVQQIVAGTGLTGGTITGSGTIALATPVSLTLGGTGVASVTANALLVGNGLNPLGIVSIGSIGFVLSSNGTAGPPTWIAASGTGTVQSISTANGIGGGPITTTGTISMDPTTARQPTINILAGSGTYTIPIINGVRAQILEVVMRGAGGGGGGSGANPVDGSAGGGTSFALIVAAGGSGGGANTQSGHPELGGIAGAGGLNGAGVATQRIPGAPGGNGQASTSGTEAVPAGNGGGEGAGAGGYASTGSNPVAGAAGAGASGGGGGGAAPNSTSLYGSGAGGGQGEYVLLLLASGSSITYPYAVGAGGAAGTGSAVNGGAGGSGYIRVRASWQ